MISGAVRNTPPAAAAEAREDADTIQAAVRSLPEKQRVALSLYYVNGYSQRQIAEFLEVPLGTVKSRLHASRSRLKQRMLKMVAETLNDG